MERQTPGGHHEGWPWDAPSMLAPARAAICAAQRAVRHDTWLPTRSAQAPGDPSPVNRPHNLFLGAPLCISARATKLGGHGQLVKWRLPDAAVLSPVHEPDSPTKLIT